MKVSEISIKQLAKIINGDEIGRKIITPYRSGSKLVEFFNNFGFDDIYEKGFPSRWKYTEDKLMELNATKNMEILIISLVESQQYLFTDFKLENVVECINKIIAYDGYTLEKFDNEYVVVGEGLIKEELVQVKPTFEDIQNEIIKEIRKAKYTIWIAVAWFTDKVLFDELIKKKNDGVNIQIIVCNDDTTKNYGFNYEEYFETHRKEKFGAYKDNILHTKFCIIDLYTVIQGSYNWTNKAQYNDESVETIWGREHAEKYADRFKILKLDKVG